MASIPMFYFIRRIHFRGLRPALSIWQIRHVVRDVHFTLKRLKLSVLVEMHTNLCTAPRLQGV